MSTALFENIIFGPVSSRRLGVSLGVNLLPQHGKLCDFDCIYCECGWNSQHREDNRLPSSEEVASALEGRLKAFAEEGKPLDTITFSGNGEPTLHPDFPEIIDNTLRLRDKYCPKAKVSVLSNATMIWKPRVREALLKVDNPILKLDSPDIEVVRSVNTLLRQLSKEWRLSKAISYCRPYFSRVQDMICWILNGCGGGTVS